LFAGFTAVDGRAPTLEQVKADFAASWEAFKELTHKTNSQPLVD
jgi:hypothetical protein